MRGDLSEAEWELVEPHLPLGERGPIPDLRRYFNAVMWRFRTGSPWRDIPERYGPWSTVYGRFQIWVAAGTFQTLMDTMIAETASRGQVDLSLVSVDSTVSREHHHAAGMAVDPELLAELEKAAAEESCTRQQCTPSRFTAASTRASSPRTGPHDLHQPGEDVRWGRALPDRAAPRQFRLDQLVGSGAMDRDGASARRLISPPSPRIL